MFLLYLLEQSHMHINHVKSSVFCEYFLVCVTLLSVLIVPVIFVNFFSFISIRHAWRLDQKNILTRLSGMKILVQSNMKVVLNVAE